MHAQQKKRKSCRHAEHAGIDDKFFKVEFRLFAARIHYPHAVSKAEKLKHDNTCGAEEHALLAEHRLCKRQRHISHIAVNAREFEYGVIGIILFSKERNRENYTDDVSYRAAERRDKKRFRRLRSELR